MPVVFSRACEYALRALFEMARNPEREAWTIQELANRTDTPAPFLAKTFQSLVKEEILNSTKGRKGGFVFARKPSKIFLMEIVDAIDGPALARDCALGMPTCNDAAPCPFHRHWKAIRTSIISALQHEVLTNAALANPTKSKGLPSPS